MAADPQRAPRREESAPSIPGYELLGFIGRGASGTVFRARQLAVDREVAIKILHPQVAGDSRVVRRLQREARTTARLAHPHIVSAVDMGETPPPDRRWWYAMELVDGPSLAARLRSEGRIREREALRLFIPLCEALEHLWEHGVVHRDIKPANILIDRASGARLADLGLAVAEDDPSITGTGGTLGTPHYISPEQAVDSRKADVKSDIWSFGATLYHAVCGRPPFSGESAAEVLSGVLYSRIPDPEELEPALSSRLALVLRKCLTRDPARRYQNPHELLLDLERVRERRAPRIARRALDPVQRRGDRRVRALLALTTALVVVLVALALFLPRLLRDEPPAGPDLAGEPGPFAPLEELATRRASGIGKPAELLGELREMGPRVPERDRARYDELCRAVDEDLWRGVRALRTEIEAEVDREIEAGDLEAGWRTLTDELEPRFVLLTGYGLSGLETLGLDQLSNWRDRLALKLDSATDWAVSELEALLSDWRSARLSEVEASLSQQDWERAFAALRLPDAQGLCDQAGFKLRLPAASRAGLLEDLGLEFRARAQRLQDDWLRLDRELKLFVLTRRATLEKKLREGPPRIAAETLLRGDFERELFERRLSRQKMPAGLSRAGLEELEASARALAELEESLLELDARTDYGEIEELAGEALRLRDYERALGLWEEARTRTTGAARFEASSARQELARRVDLRIEEAALLDRMLARVSDRIRELDGQTIALRWGSITYPAARIEAGPDPRHLGFKAEKVAGVLQLVGLPAQEVEAFAGFGADEALGPEERLTLALFRFHEGRAPEAYALLSGPLPGDEPGRSLVADLADRIAGALESGERRAEEREAEARALLERVLDPELQGHSPRVVQARIARLLDSYGDLPPVKQQRGELLRLRASLEERAPRADELEFRRVYAPDRLELTALGRVTLGYDFGEGRAGPWESGDWVFDGLGLVLGRGAPIAGWDQLAAERGLRLVLRPPLVADSLELRLRFEALQGEVPARILWVTAGGFHLALSAPDLPGAPGGPRFLVGTEEGNAFLQRMLAGEGTHGDSLLVPGGPPRDLRFKVLRRRGRCELYLDGELLASTTGLRSPPGDPLSLSIRSWGAVRVLGVELEGGR